jgi:hypothetical protein
MSPAPRGRLRRGRPPGVGGGFLSFFGGGSYRIRILMYFDVSCMYPACILKEEGYMYTLCILMYLRCNTQMYLKCPVTFQENTCILIFCMYFTVSRTSPRYILGYI